VTGPREPTRTPPGADPEPPGLPELAGVRWRPRASRRSIAARGRMWTLWSLGYTLPFTGVGALLLALEPWSFPVALGAFAHAWIIPELYAARGAGVVRPRAAAPHRGEPVAQRLLGDLLGHEERELQRRTGLALEPGALGTWLVGEAGALLVARGGRRVHCFCVRVPDPDLPPADRIAHLLLAVRSDEAGFATVANHAFAGAPWRVRRRLPKRMRPALDSARSAAR
jgi:hypothetical protein